MHRNQPIDRRSFALGFLSLAAFVGALSCASTTAPPTIGELINPALSPARAQWLVGPISRLATREEIDAYLRVGSDAEAEEFVRAFWRRRNPEAGSFFNEVRETFESRVEEADDRFSESGASGNRSDRGTIYVIYGEPDSIEFEVGPVESSIGLEVWRYEEDREPGLNGKSPERWYRFYKPQDRTIRYRSVVPSDPARRARQVNGG